MRRTNHTCSCRKLEVSCADSISPTGNRRSGRGLDTRAARGQSDTVRGPGAGEESCHYWVCVPEYCCGNNSITLLLTRCSPTGPRCKLSNGRTVTNLASYNYYNLVTNEQLKERAIQTLRTYGVGPCGPPGFYGTQDVHMKIEEDIAAFLGTTACIIYAQAFSTISSVIPAFSKRGDIIVADRAVNYAIRKGIQISRSSVRWYEHNDLADLERVLARVVKEQAKKPLTRRFIICEGLSELVGDMLDLPKVVSCS